MNTENGKTLLILIKYELACLVGLRVVRVLFKLTGSAFLRKLLIKISKRRAMRKFFNYCTALELHAEFMPANTLLNDYSSEKEKRSNHRLFFIHYEIIGQPRYFAIMMYLIKRYPIACKRLYTLKMDRAVRRYHNFLLLESNDPTVIMTV